MIGKIKDIVKDFFSKKYIISFTVDDIGNLEKLKEADLDIDVKKHREKRSLNANALLWKCLNDIAVHLQTDKWSIYLQMLKRYGTFTYICVHPSAVASVKKQWRECEEIGNININGKDAVQLLCYFGSSTYNTKEFSTLLDGVISEMKEMGIPTPQEKELERVIKEWEKVS